MKTIARFAVRHRWYVIGGWVAFILLSQLLATAAGGATYKNVFTLPHTQTQTVFDLLKSSGQTSQTGQLGTVVVHAKSGTLDPAAAPAGLMPALNGLCTQPFHVASIISPWGAIYCPGTPAPAQHDRPANFVNPPNPLLSKDGTTALVNINWQGNQNSSGNFTGVYNSLKKLANASTQYEFTNGAFGNLAAKQGSGPQIFGFVAALLVLAIVFRSVGATALPLLSAAAALGAGLGLISLLSHTMNVADFTTQLSTLMVIGVGVDYALFIVTRHRRNLLRGMPMEQSISVAIDTSGRAVLFAGATVCVAILGLLTLGVSFLYGVAVGTALAVALTMVASLTLLPAVLSLLGYRVLPRRLRRALLEGSYVDAQRKTRWAWWSELVAKHKIVLGAATGGLIIVMAIPFFSMRLGHADQSNDPTGTTTRVGYDLITQHFGAGYNSTLELVLHGPQATDPSYLARVDTALAQFPNVDPATVRPAPLNSDLTLVSFKSKTSPQEVATDSLVKDLRSQLAPALQNGTSTKIYVYGQTAVYIDFAKVLASKMPLFFAAIIALSFLLLMVAFRSLVVPLTAALMNLFAAGASFGVLVAVFQWGWFAGVLGIGKGGPIEAFLPVMFFAVLFGLSMDYQVFLVSRVHEEWIHTRNNKRSVTVGQTETGGIITAAAIIMITVFGGFLLGNGRVIKMFGLGLGGAVFVDAFILRTVLVPSLMHALGRTNWYFPKWLDRLVPHVSVDPHEEDAEEQGPEPTKELAEV